MHSIICCLSFCTVLLNKHIGSLAIQQVSKECCQNMCNISVSIYSPQKESESNNPSCTHSTPYTNNTTVWVQWHKIGGKIIFQVKKCYFVCSTDFKLLTQIKGNSVNNCDFLSPYFLLWVVIVIIHPGAKKHSYTLA